MKKYLYILLSLLLLFSLSACGAKQEAAEQASEAPQEKESVLVWRGGEDSLYPFEAGFQLHRVARSGSTLMIAGSRDGEIALALADFSLDENGEVTLSQQRPGLLDEPSSMDTVSVYGLSGDADGHFYLLTGEAPPLKQNAGGMLELNNPDFSGCYRLICLDASGQESRSFPLEYLFQSDYTLRGLLRTENGFLLYGTTGYLLTDDAGTITKAVELETIHISSLQLCEAGLIASCYDYGEAENGPCALNILPDGSYERLPFPEQNGSLFQNDGSSFLYNDSTGIFSYDFARDESSTLLEWPDAESAVSVCQLGERSFACTMSGSGALLLLHGQQEEYSRQSVVKVLVNAELSDMIKQLTAMNKADSPYYYEYTTRDLEDEGELTRLLTEITAGSAPDLILYNASDLNGSCLNTSSSAFEDLYPFIDADESLERDDFLPGLLPALETGGELHELWLSVEIRTLAARVSDVGDGKNLTAEDLSRIYQDAGKYKCMIYDTAAADFLSRLAQIGIAQFVDASAGTCHFDDPAFRSLLAWCGEQSFNRRIPPEESMMSEEYINLFRLMHLEEALMHEPFVFTGYPSADGCGNFYVSSGRSCCRAAIPAGSQNKEGAWAFLRAQLAVDSQVKANAPMYTALPVIYEALERAAYEPIGMDPMRDYMSDDQREQLFDLLARTNKAKTAGDEQLIDFIVSAGQAYLAGDKTLDETVALIQNHASIYLAEQYG